MRTLLVLILLAAPLALATHTPIGRCDGDGWPALGIVMVGRGDTAFYVDDRNYLLGNGVWVYQETNGIWAENDPAHSLQRGGGSIILSDDAASGDAGAESDPDICVDDPYVEPDRMLF